MHKDLCVLILSPERDLLSLGLTALAVAEGSSDGSSEADLSVLQVFPLQISDGDGLLVKLIAQLLILGDGPGDHQHVLEQEHMQLLQRQRCDSLLSTVL